VGGVDGLVVGTVAFAFYYFTFDNEAGFLDFLVEWDFVKLPKQEVGEE